jgi:Fe-S-cluster containining protein
MPSEGTGDRVTFNVEFSAGERTIEASVDIPDAPMRTADLFPILLSFSNAIVALAEDAAKSAGRKITCRAGCGACCRQLVPLSEHEARYISEVVAGMPAPQQDRVRERFRAAGAALGDDLAGRLRDTDHLKTLEQRRTIGIEYFQKRVPCPFLDDEQCSIHPHRPLSCREYLVTSPAGNCADPGPGRIDPVPMPIKLSEILYCFDEAGGKQGARWVPLVLALDWAEEHAADPRNLLPAPKLFEAFLGRVAAARGGANEAEQRS